MAIVESLSNGREVNGLSNPVFIVGVFRSGTSLLYSLLNQHPQMAFMYECDVWDFPAFLSRLRFKGNWLERQEFYNQALSRHRLILGRSLRGLEQIRTPSDLYQTFGKSKDAMLWGEKSPYYCSRLKQLARANPGSPFVLIWRDPVEVYQSIYQAGRVDRFFRRRGILSRLIVYQEQMVRQAAGLERLGARVHHVNYADLIDRTTDACESICRFLGVPFDPQMLDLSQANLSAVYQAPLHNHLRRGVIERRRAAREVLNPIVVQKLERFRNRWSRINCVWFPPREGTTTAEPSLFERSYHQTIGALAFTWDGSKRALFEFLPLTWLRTYRENANWLFPGRDVSPKRQSLREQIADHWGTLFVCYASIAGIAAVHSFVNPRFTLLPVYLIPCAVLALTMNRRWATIAALISSCIGPTLLSKVDSEFAQFELLLWNTTMRFLLLQIVISLIDRARSQSVPGNEAKTGQSVNPKADSPPQR